MFPFRCPRFSLCFDILSFDVSLFSPAKPAIFSNSASKFCHFSKTDFLLLLRFLRCRRQQFLIYTTIVLMLSLQMNFCFEICSHGFDLFFIKFWTRMIQMICVTSVLWQSLYQVDVKVPVLENIFVAN